MKQKKKIKQEVFVKHFIGPFGLNIKFVHFTNKVIVDKTDKTHLIKSAH